jgi:hypothetical protein
MCGQNAETVVYTVIAVSLLCSDHVLIFPILCKLYFRAELAPKVSNARIKFYMSVGLSRRLFVRM